MRTWTVWSEGFAATGQSGGAVCHGTYEAPTFLDACHQAAQRQRWGSDFRVCRETPTYWGCRLFPSEEEARRSFG